MTTDSGTYDQATIQRRQKIAEAMLGDAMKPQDIRHWTQGLAQLARAGIGGLQLSQANEDAKALKAQDTATLMSILGGGTASAPEATPSAPVMPAPKPPANVPVATAMTPAAPPPVNAPRAEVMPSAKVWGDKEAEAAGLYEPSPPKPAPGMKVAQAMTPQANLSPAIVPSPPATPTAPAAPIGSIMSGLSPQQKAALIAGLGASEDSAARKVAMTMLGSALKPQEYGFQTQPDGTILRTDPRTGTVSPIYQGATKPTFGVIGEEDGKKTYGFIDPVKGKVTPLEPAKPNDERPTVDGPDGKPIVVPKGIDVPTFKKEIAKINADAAAGKMTEVQAKATSFAGRMEQAEKAVKGLEEQALGLKGAAQQVGGNVPVVGSAFQSKDYQKFAQAKSQFITAVLRQESGAAINKDEFNRYDKEFFPQPGDSKEVIDQKRAARGVAIEAMKKSAGPSYKSPDAAAKPSRVTKSIGGKNYYQENGQWFEE